MVEESDVTTSARIPFLPAMGRHGPLALYDPFTRLLGVRKQHQRLIDQARLRPREHVLDIGCGTGNLTVLAAQQQLAATVVGLDPDPEVLKRADRKAGRTGLDIRFDQGHAQALPYEDASFDTVLCALALHHVPEEHRMTALREIGRVLTAGGTLHVLEMANGHAGGLVGRLLRQSPHGQAWGQVDVTDLMQQAGLSDPVELDRTSNAVGTFAFYIAEKGRP
jgi:ubiquinone/menaquinone biosynthesis C-methylase UbiE